jgi:uncharacterized pyridoxamine 5'-phosphate oxidase family protein
MTREQAIEFIKQVHIGYLATIDTENKPQVRPVAVDTFYDDELYFFTFCTTRKVAEMAAHPQVEVCWTNVENLTQVRFSGRSAVVTDEGIQKRFKEDNPKVAELLPPEAAQLFQLYKVIPEKVEAAVGLVPYEQIAW